MQYKYERQAMQTMGGGHEGQDDNHKQEVQERHRMQRKQNANVEHLHVQI